MAQALAPLTTGSCRHQDCFCGGSRTVGDENTLCGLSTCGHPLGEHNPLQSGSLLFCPQFSPRSLLNLFSSFCFLILVCDFSFLISVVNIYFLLFIDFFCLVLVFSSAAQPVPDSGLIFSCEFAFLLECGLLFHDVRRRSASRAEVC